jgi:MFS family permease
MNEIHSQNSNSKKLSPRIWFVLSILAVTGQIAWAVENSWFNTFVFDTITPDPRPVAWMVAASAITATITTLLMGTLSDRTRSKLGRRRPFILFGYILWGISTALFPTVAYIKVTSVAIFAVILADVMMTFFGSTANDAAFNAWTADITDNSNRGKIEGALQAAVFIAQIITLGAAGILIDQVGYFIFFYALGGIVLLSGLVAGGLLQDASIPESEEESKQKSVFIEIIDAFRLDSLRANRVLFLLFINIMIFAIGANVSMPYLIVYLENFVGMTKTEFSLVGSAVLLGSALSAIPVGLMADRWDRRKIIIFASIGSAIGGVMFSFGRTIPYIVGTALIWQPMVVAVAVSTVAWMKDLLPEESRGKFLGVRMIFWIMIPMVFGPMIGSQLIQSFGVPTMLNGEAGFIPTPIIFQVGAVISVLSIIPLFYMKSASKIQFRDDQK